MQNKKYFVRSFQSPTGRVKKIFFYVKGTQCYRFHFIIKRTKSKTIFCLHRFNMIKQLTMAEYKNAIAEMKHMMLNSIDKFNPFIN